MSDPIEAAAEVIEPMAGVDGEVAAEIAEALRSAGLLVRRPTELGSLRAEVATLRPMVAAAVALRDAYYAGGNTDGAAWAAFDEVIRDGVASLLARRPRPRGATLTVNEVHMGLLIDVVLAASIYIEAGPHSEFHWQELASAVNTWRETTMEMFGDGARRWGA